MLILVSQLIENCFGRIKQKLESIIVLLVLGFPMLGFAQQANTEFLALPLPTGQLSEGVDEIAEQAAGFHQQLGQEHISTRSLISTLSIGPPQEDTDPIVSLETLAPPEPPRDLLMPVGPTARSFGEPLGNDLGAESVQRKSEPRVVNANAEIPIVMSPLATRGSFVPVQDGTNQSQRPAGKFTADNLRSELIPAFDKDQVESTASQTAPPMNKPMQEVFLASQIPTHAATFTPPKRARAVQLAGFSEPLDKKNKSTKFIAKELIARYAVGQYENPLPGQPVNLVNFFRQPLTINRRNLLVRQYWETYFDWANYVATEKYSQWLRQIPVPASSSDQALLTAVEAVVGSQVMAAEIQLGKSQAILTQFLPTQSQNSTNPIPNDLPLIQRYNTNYELYLSKRLVPLGFRGIDKVLPKMLALIEMRAEGVGYAKSATDRVLVPTEGTSLLTILEAGKILYTAERDLIASVVSYNRAIGDYALAVSTQPKSAEEVVGMLIAKVKTNTTSANAIPSDGSASVIAQSRAPIASVAKARGFVSQAPTGNPQKGTTSVLQPQKNSSILDDLNPRESDILLGRQPPPRGGVIAQSTPLPKVNESDSVSSLSPANKPAAFNSSTAKSQPAPSGFSAPANFKAVAPLSEGQFAAPAASGFKFKSESPKAAIPGNGFRPPGVGGVGKQESNNSVGAGGFEPPVFSSPGFKPANDK